MLIYDLEILNAIPSQSEPRQEGIEYCNGWSDTAGMGIACVCAWDYVADRAHVFCRDNLADFLALTRQHDVCIGFNNRRFDNAVLASNGIALRDEDSYDLYLEIMRGLGINPNDPTQRRSGYSLAAMSYANFHHRKSGEGKDAPALFQKGNIGRVINYCLNDIYITKRLIDRVIRRGNLIDPNDVKHCIRIRRPGV